MFTKYTKSLKNKCLNIVAPSLFSLCTIATREFSGIRIIPSNPLVKNKHISAKASEYQMLGCSNLCVKLGAHGCSCSSTDSETMAIEMACDETGKYNGR